MTIETKYNVGDEVWYVDILGEIHQATVSSFAPRTDGRLVYTVQGSGLTASRLEDELWLTTEQCYTALAGKHQALADSYRAKTGFNGTETGTYMVNGSRVEVWRKRSTGRGANNL